MGAGESEICRAAHRLETQVRVDVAGLDLNSLGQQAGNQAGFLYCSLENSFFLGKPQSLLLRPSSDWMKLTWVMEGPLLYSWSTDLTVNHIEKRPSHQHLDWCLTKQLGTMA